MIDNILVLIVSVFLFSIALLGIEERKPTKRQIKNNKLWKKFWGNLFRNDVFMETQFFFIGLFILTATVFVAFKLGGVL